METKTDDGKKSVLYIVINKRDGGHINKYAEVDAETFNRWNKWSERQDYANMKTEAPKVLRMSLSVEDAEKHMAELRKVTPKFNVLVCNLGPFTFLDEVLP